MSFDHEQDKSSTEAKSDGAGNKIPLNKETATEIRQLRKNIRDNLIELIEKAHNIRMQHLGENGKGYDADFHRWWRNENMKTEFGELPNFTKYAAAGEEWEKGGLHGYRDKLPLTLNGLYEVFLCNPDEVKLALQNTFTKESLTAKPTSPMRPKPVIHPEATARQIRRWRERWRDPSKRLRKPHDKLTLDELAEIEAAVEGALKPWKGYEVAKELQEVLARTRRRLERMRKSGSGSASDTRKPPRVTKAR
jgi:hypothetical protein